MPIADEAATRSVNPSWLLDQLTTAVLVFDQRLCVTFINHAAEGLLAISRQHALNQSLDSIVKHGRPLLQAMQRAQRDHAPFTQRQVQLGLATQLKTLLVDISGTPLMDGGVIVELQSIERMVRINREEALVSSQLTTRHLARGLAHEVKNPLGGIRGAAQLLARELPDPELAEYTQIIISEVDRLRDLVDRMLGSHERPEMSSVNIHEVLERVQKVIKAEYGDAVVLSRDYDPSLPEVIGSRDQLVQAVLNVVRNGVQALLENNIEAPEIVIRSRAQRYVTVGRIQHKLMAKIDILDNGPGIPDDLKDTIFYPMISGRADGTGLGLAMAQSIVATHKGLIECESRQGHTRFSIYLPLDLPS